MSLFVLLLAPSPEALVDEVHARVPDPRGLILFGLERGAAVPGPGRAGDRAGTVWRRSDVVVALAVSALMATLFWGAPCTRSTTTSWTGREQLQSPDRALRRPRSEERRGQVHALRRGGPAVPYRALLRPRARQHAGEHRAFVRADREGGARRLPRDAGGTGCDRGDRTPHPPGRHRRPGVRGGDAAVAAPSSRTCRCRAATAGLGVVMARDIEPTRSSTTGTLGAARDPCGAVPARSRDRPAREPAEAARGPEAATRSGPGSHRARRGRLPASGLGRVPARVPARRVRRSRLGERPRVPSRRRSRGGVPARWRPARTASLRVATSPSWWGPIAPGRSWSVGGQARRDAVPDGSFDLVVIDDLRAAGAGAPGCSGGRSSVRPGGTVVVGYRLFRAGSASRTELKGDRRRAVRAARRPAARLPRGPGRSAASARYFVRQMAFAYRPPGTAGARWRGWQSCGTGRDRRPARSRAARGSRADRGVSGSRPAVDPGRSSRSWCVVLDRSDMAGQRRTRLERTRWPPPPRTGVVTALLFPPGRGEPVVAKMSRGTGATDLAPARGRLAEAVSDAVTAPLRPALPARSGCTGRRHGRAAAERRPGRHLVARPPAAAAP